MSHRVSISMKAARALAEHGERYGVDHTSPLGRAFAEVASGLEPRRRGGRGRKAQRVLRRLESLDVGGPLPSGPAANAKALKRARRQDVRTAVFLRAGGRCEGPWAHDPNDLAQCPNVPTDLSHLFGKGKGHLPESERTCAAWCRQCHEAFGASEPSAQKWWERIAWWLDRQGFAYEADRARARARFCEVRAALPAAPRPTKETP